MNEDAGTRNDLEHRVMLFQTLQLPGQPMMMHMGTANLVADLWEEIQRLRSAFETINLTAEGK